MDEKWKIIFLDFDGVINGSGPVRYIIWKILYEKLKLKKLYEFIYPEDVYDVHKKKVKKLALLCKLTNARVVVSSSWRYHFYEYYNRDKQYDDSLPSRTAELFHKNNIMVIGVTPKSQNGKRQDEIITYLSRYEKKIENFIIYDDEWSDLGVFLKDELILTTDANPMNRIHGYWYCRDGIRLIHIIKGFKKLNIKKK